jgi:hypothetical protein
MIGVHRWLHKRNPEGGATYLECERCQKQKDTMTLSDFSGDRTTANPERSPLRKSMSVTLV